MDTHIVLIVSNGQNVAFLDGVVGRRSLLFYDSFPIENKKATRGNGQGVVIMEGSVELGNMPGINANRNGEVDGEEGDAEGEIDENSSSSSSAAEFEISDTSDDEALDRNAQEEYLERIISNTNSVATMKRFIRDRIRGDHRLDLEPFIERLGTTARQRIFIEALHQSTSLRSIQIPFALRNFLLCEDLWDFCRTSPSLRVCGFVHGREPIDERSLGVLRAMSVFICSEFERLRKRAPIYRG